MNNYKGIYYKESKEQKYFEGGAHFQYKELYSKLLSLGGKELNHIMLYSNILKNKNLTLNKISCSFSHKNKSKKAKPRTRNIPILGYVNNPNTKIEEDSIRKPSFSKLNTYNNINQTNNINNIKSINRKYNEGKFIETSLNKKKKLWIKTNNNILIYRKIKIKLESDKINNLGNNTEKKSRNTILNKNILQHGKTLVNKMEIRNYFNTNHSTENNLSTNTNTNNNIICKNYKNNIIIPKYIKKKIAQNFFSFTRNNDINSVKKKNVSRNINNNFENNYMTDIVKFKTALGNNNFIYKK